MVNYIHEPFNTGLKFGVNQTNPLPFNTGYHYIDSNNRDDFENTYARILDFHYPLKSSIKHISEFHDALRVARNVSRSHYHRWLGSRPLVKDPMAFFSTPWLYKQFDFDVVMTIRHPAAFCSSMKLKNWWFNFDELLAQDLLMDTYLSDYKEEMQKFSDKNKYFSLVQRAALLWRCIYATMRTFQEQYPQWTFIKHEQLSSNPLLEFQSLYEKLGLDFSNSVRDAIHNASGEQNPIEQNKADEFKRNSVENIWNWKSRLDSNEIDFIRRYTHKESTFFYDASDW